MTEYEEGDTFRSPDDGRYWQITDLQVQYVVTIRPEGDEYSDDDLEKVTYPADVLTRKLEWGDIEPVDFEGGQDSTDETDDSEPEEPAEKIADEWDEVADDPASDDSEESAEESEETETDGGMYGCTICEKSFETAHGLATHKGVQH